MGRRPDPPEVQAAKGFPGKRKTKVERQLAEAAELAELMASAPAEDGQPLAPPAFLDERFGPALVVWREYAPRLAKMQLLDVLDRYSFALFCVYYGEWVAANEDIQATGYSVKVKTVSGDLMPRLNPSVLRRKLAFDALTRLMPAFGLTPLDRFALVRHQAVAPLGPLFDKAPGGAGQRPDDVPHAADDDDPIGALQRLDSVPPASRPN